LFLITTVGALGCGWVVNIIIHLKYFLNVPVQSTLLSFMSEDQLIL